MQARPPHTNGFHDLEIWKMELLRIWSQNSALDMLDKDLISFSEILNLSVGVITALLDDIRANIHTQRAADLDPSSEVDPVSLSLSTPSKGKGRAIAPEKSTSSPDLLCPEAIPEWALTPTQMEDDQLCVDSTGLVHDLQRDYDVGSSSSIAPGRRINEPSHEASEHATWNLESSSATDESGDSRFPSSVTSASTSHNALLLQCINEDIQAKKYKNCRRFDRSVAQRGDVPCTLGCGRLFRSACDRNRHEETMYPQKYWFCYLCMDMNDPSQDHLFTRLDKLRCHNEKHHAGQLRINPCRVSSTRTLFPRKCGICPYTFRSQHDRSRHIAMHHSGSRKDHAPVHHMESAQTSQIEHSEPKQLEPGQAFREIQIADTQTEISPPSLPVASQSGAKDSFPIMQVPDNVSIVRFQPLLVNKGSGSLPLDPRLLAIEWSSDIEGEGASSRVIKAKIALDDRLEYPSEPRYVAIKVVREHGELFDQEVKAFEHISAMNPRPAIVKCYGTFDHIDNQGRTTHNFVLEHAECNLWQYWSRTMPPESSVDAAAFYSQLFNISAALGSIHQVTDKSVGYAFTRYAGIKPENILYFSGHSAIAHGLKLADCGLSEILKVEFLWQSELAEGREDVLVIFYCCYSHTLNHKPGEIDTNTLIHPLAAIMQQVDIRSFGRVLSLAATWLLKGFQGVQQVQNDMRVTTLTLLGTKVSPEVCAWHNHLRSCIPNVDRITGPLLDLIDDLPPSASVLYDRLMQILQNANVASPGIVMDMPDVPLGFWDNTDIELSEPAKMLCWDEDQGREY